MRRSFSPSQTLLQSELLCPQLGRGDSDGQPLVTPIAQTTSFSRQAVGSDPQHQYSRVSNPTVATLEKALGDLEDALPAACYSTGLAAESGLFLSVLQAGDHVVCGQSVYGGTTRLLRQLLSGLGIETSFVDSTDPNAVALAVRPITRLVFVETPSNPTLDITDIAACARIAHDNDALLAVDNTFQTAVLQRPLDLGADISVYSTTKFIDGHSVALGGALVTRDDRLLERFQLVRKCTGAIQTPFNAWLTLNGLKTLPLRMQRHAESACRIAQWLDGQPQARVVHHPSLAGSQAAALAEKQHMDGLHGAVLSFEVEGGLEAARALTAATDLCGLAEHVGSADTLLTHPATMTHADVPADQRRAAGLADGLLRLSVGLEPAESIIQDLQRGLQQAASFSFTDDTGKEIASCLRSA